MLTDRGIYRKWAADAERRARVFQSIERLARATAPRQERTDTPRFSRFEVHGCGAALDPERLVKGLYARPTLESRYSHTWLMCPECDKDFFSRMLTDYEFMERIAYTKPVCGDSVRRGETGYLLERRRADWASDPNGDSL